jgi:hypothetical protein
VAQRLSVKTVPSVEVQGEGSWVKLRAVTVGEAEDMRSLADLPEDENSPEYRAKQDDIFKKLATIVIEWDWVDDDGTPLPCPPKDWTVFKRLTTDEMAFLNRAMVPSQKN